MARVAVIGISGGSYFMSCDHFHEKGETVRADSLHYEIGGKGINQALAAHRAGAEVSFLAAVGSDADADACRRFADEHGIKGYFIEKKGVPTATAFILTDKSGENRVTVFRGASLEEADVEVFREEICGADVLLLQNEVDESVNIRAATLARESGVRVVLNPAPARALSPELARLLYLVTPNEQESHEESLAAENVAVTLGEQGCLINGTTRVPAYPVIPIDTTGAGDTFNGFVCARLAFGDPLDAACRLGCVAAGISVTRRGVAEAIPTMKEIERSEKNE